MKDHLQRFRNLSARQKASTILGILFIVSIGLFVIYDVETAHLFLSNEKQYMGNLRGQAIWLAFLYALLKIIG